MPTRPIVIIEDNAAYRQILKEAFLLLNYPNQLIFFSDGLSALEYLRSYKKKPFLIFSDINMPLMNGFELRDQIHADEELRINCLPYIFFTTSQNPTDILQAYSKSVQGFFVKPSGFQALQDLLKTILDYWIYSKSPYDYLN